MFISIDNINFKYISNSIILFDAITYILSKDLSTQDKIIDRYLKENFNTGLKNMCIKLIYNAKLQKVSTNNLRITFNKDDDEIASIITYGTGRFTGSNILIEAFGSIR